MNVGSAITWVVLADAGGARILSHSADHPDLKVVVEWTTVEGEGSARRREQFSDRLPRTQDSHGDARHAIEPHSSPDEIHADRLAGDIAGRLTEGLRKGAFAHLVLIAPPRFAGRLDAALDGAVDACVVARLRKDLRHESLPDVQARLAELG